MGYNFMSFNIWGEKLKHADQQCIIFLNGTYAFSPSMASTVLMAYYVLGRPS